jgi:hypothetical protein
MNIKLTKLFYQMNNICEMQIKIPTVMQNLLRLQIKRTILCNRKKGIILVINFALYVITLILSYDVTICADTKAHSENN